MVQERVEGGGGGGCFLPVFHISFHKFCIKKIKTIYDE
jgi:hypothetical protein